ncbi:MAG TPA: amidase [bacterium]|nr:amidase [bacterium]
MAGTASGLLDLVEVAARIRARDVSPVALVESARRGIEAWNPTLNAYITVLGQDAQAAAEQAEREIASGVYRGPLHGVPLSVKDLYWTRGIRTTAGSRVLNQFVPSDDATVVRRLRESGAVLIAKANTLEFAYASVHPDYGPAKNPWDLTRSASGSSSGSAVAVAAGLDFGSFGTDTGGSIRLPASFCGVAGFKPTYGLVSRFGVVPLAETLDHAGPLARSVRDVAVLLQAVAGYDPLDPTTARSEVPAYPDLLGDDLRGVTAALVVNLLEGEVAPEVRAAVLEAARVVADAGATVREMAIPELDGDVMTARTQITQAEASHFHRQWIDAHWADYTPLVQARLKAGLELPAVTYIEALEVRRRTRHRIREIQQTLDLLLLPTAPTVATPLEGTVPAQDVARKEGEIKGLGRRTSPFSLTGQPALSVPCGFSGGLPMGLQIVGRDFEDALVLRAGHAFQARTDWHRRRPPTSVSYVED